MKPTFETILSGHFVEYTGDYMHVTLIKAQNARDIPRVVYSWTPHDYAAVTAEQAARLPKPVNVKDGLVRVARADKDGKPEVQHVTLMNFRRYGWCTAAGYNAEHWYAGGITYTNNCDGGIQASSSEQLIRDTLIATVAQLRYGSVGVPGKLLDSTVNRTALAYLLQDALDNQTEHAYPKPVGSDASWDTRMGVTSEGV